MGSIKNPTAFGHGETRASARAVLGTSFLGQHRSTSVARLVAEASSAVKVSCAGVSGREPSAGLNRQRSVEQEPG